MKFENAIIIALIVIILVIVGAYFLAGDGTSDDQTQNSVVDTNPNPVSTDVQSSSQSSSSSSSQSDVSDAADSSSAGEDSQEPASVVESDSSAPQAGQAEGTYDPTDFD